MLSSSLLQEASTPQMSIITGNQPPMRGHGLLAMFLIIFILSLFISFCATARCDAGCRTIYYIWRASVLRLMHGSGFQTHYIFASPAWLPPSFQFSMVLPLRVSPVFFTVMV